MNSDKYQKFDILHSKITEVDEKLNIITDQTQKKFLIVKENVNNNSSLQISGYSDKIGDSEYNKTLSKKRTESVSAQFPNNKKELFPYGESIIIYNNNLPEGRVYSRTVTIKAITPVNK